MLELVVVDDRDGGSGVGGDGCRTWWWWMMEQVVENAGVSVTDSVVADAGFGGDSGW